MAEESTMDEMMEISEKTRRFVLRMASTKELLAGLDPKVRLAGLSPKERLAGPTIEQRRKLLRFLQEEMDAAAGDQTDDNGDAASLMLNCGGNRKWRWKGRRLPSLFPCLRRAPFPKEKT